MTTPAPELSRVRRQSATTPRLEAPADPADVPARPRRRWLRAAGTGLILGVWGFALIAQWQALQQHTWSLEAGPLFGGFLWAGASWLLIATGWWQAVRAVGGSIGAGPAIRIWIATMVYRYLPGNVWHLAGRVYWGGRAGESRAALLAGSALEQVLTLAGACLLILITLPGWPAGRWLAAPAALGLAGTWLILQPALGRPILDLLARRTGRAILPVFPSPGRVTRLTALFALAHAVTGLSTWAVASAIGRPADLLPCLGATAAAWTIGYLSLLTPSGLGVREGALTLLLTPTLGAPAALLVSVLARAVQMAAEAAAWGLEVGVQGLGFGVPGRDGNGVPKASDTEP